jgi:3-oxoacyl-[acyl-carrier-protein] synthase-3
MSLKILGAGMAHPGFVLSNSALSEIVETDDQWITTRTGIKSRFISTNESLLDIAMTASKNAMQNSGLKSEDLDLIICSTIQGDNITPALSCEIQHELGASCPAFDVNAACTGFIYALDIAKSYFDAGRSKNILIVSAEQMSKLINWQDRSTCVLFGDGAGAVVVTKGSNLKAIKVTAKGNSDLLEISGLTGNNPYWEGEKPDLFLHMKGKEVFKFAVNSMCNDIIDVLAESGRGIEDVTKVIPHQANIRIIRSAADKLGLRDDQLAVNVDRYGNTSSASVPILLGELMESGELKEGDIIVLSAFGGGLTSGACIIEV